MVRLQIHQKDVLLLIMDYLREHNLLSSLYQLEKESQLSLFKYSSEIQFLRSLILEGQWQDAEGFIKTIFDNINFEDEAANSSSENNDIVMLNQIKFHIKKQIYLELLFANDLEKNQNYVVELIKEMESLGNSQEAHFKLCDLLNYSRLQSHEDYTDWTIEIGRFECFNSIKNLLNECQSISIRDAASNEKRRAPSGRLSKLLKDSVYYQYYVAKRTGTTTMFKFDPATQTSEVSLLKDIVSEDSLKKFSKSNLDEIRNIGFSYKGLKDGIFKNTGQALNSQLTDLKNQTKQNMYTTNQSKFSKTQNQNFVVPNDQYDTNAQEEINEEIDYQEDNFLPEDHDSQSEYYEGPNGILTKSMPNVPGGNFRGQYPTQVYEQNQDPRFQRLGQSVNLGAGRMQPPAQLNQQDFIPQRQANQGRIQAQQSHLQHPQRDALQPAMTGGQRSRGNPSRQRSSERQIMDQPTQIDSQQQNWQQQNAPNPYQTELMEEVHQQPQMQFHYGNQPQPNPSLQQVSFESNKMQHQAAQLQRTQQTRYQEAVAERQVPQQEQQIIQQPAQSRQMRHQKLPSQKSSSRPHMAYDEQVQQQNYMEGTDPSQLMPDIEQDQTGALNELQNLEEEESSPGRPSQVQTPAAESGPETVEPQILQMRQVTALYDTQPIRAACFSPNNSEYFVLGTNSKSLKFCKIMPHLPDLLNDTCYEEENKQEDVQVIFEQPDHHNGSIYCVDWSRTSRLVATGSNDKMIKILVTPIFEEIEEGQSNWQEDIKQMELAGHKAIVRTVCFNPLDPTVLLSGGLMESDVKVWDTETGKNVANLQGHQGNIYSIKSSFDGSFAISVGTDKMVKIWDIRCKKSVAEINGSEFPEMNEICLSSTQNQNFDQKFVSMNDQGFAAGQNFVNGHASVAHVDGVVTVWNLRMRQLVAHEKLHDADVRGISYSADGRYIASAGFDKNIVITDTMNQDKMQYVTTLEHDDKALSVKWHPYLPLLLSTSADKSARIWAPANGMRVR